MEINRDSAAPVLELVAVLGQAESPQVEERATH